MSPSFTPAQYVRREKVAATGFTVAFVGWLMGNISSQQMRGPDAGGGALLAVAVVQLLAVLAGIGTWLYARPARRAWAAALRAQAEAPGAMQPLADEERAVLVRALRRRRWVGVFLLVMAAVLLAATLGILGFLGGAEGGTTPDGPRVVAAAVCGALAAALAWGGVKVWRATGALLARARAPGAAGMRLRGPLAGRQSLAPPRFGGLPLVVLDQKWNRALRPVSGTEVELLVAPTFADDPKPNAPRVLLRLPAGAA